MCSIVPSTDMAEKVYTGKELVLLETPIKKIHEKFYIPAIQKLTFSFPHVRILGTHQRGKELHEAFNHRWKLHDVLCQRDYEEWVVSSFAQQIQY